MDTPILSYHHQHHQALVYKIFLARKSDPNLLTTLEQALAVIRHFAHVSRRMPQIIYLVGWQHDGHDSKYPDWSVVNPKLRRPQDTDSRQSLLWLMKEARKFGATVSLHINMCDAYENSPLWDEYLENDLLVRNEDGSLKKGGVWGGEQSYLVCKTREWKLGYARRRIDALVEMLSLAEAGTVHIDVFQPMPSPYHGIGRDEEIDAIKEIIAYWHSLGVDVSKEWWHHELAGMVPMVMHLNLDEAGRLRYPPSVGCGGGEGWNMRQADREQKPGGFSVMPAAGCLYEEAWGRSFSKDATHETLEELTEEFYLRTLPWFYLNRHRAIRHTQTEANYEVQFTDALVSNVRTADRHLTIRHGNRTLVDGEDVLIPALWRKEPECIAYSRSGSNKQWVLPEPWGEVKTVEIEVLHGAMQGTISEQAVCQGRLQLQLASGQSVCIRPHA